jgi:hypothetical protein
MEILTGAVEIPLYRAISRLSWLVYHEALEMPLLLLSEN